MTPLDPFNHPAASAPPSGGVLASMPPLEAEASKRRGGRTVALVIGFILVIVGLGGGVFAYYLWQRPARPPVSSQPNPQQLFSQAVSAWANVTSYSAAYDFSLTLDAVPGSAYAEELKKQGYPSTTVTGKMNGTAEVAMGDNPHGSGKINFAIPLGSDADQLFGSGVLAPVVSYVQADKDTTYFRVDSLPLLSKLGLNGVEGTWVKYVISTTTSPTTAGGTTGTSPEQQALLQQTIADLKKLYGEHPFIVMTAVLGNETEWELTVGLDRAQLKEFVVGLQQMSATKTVGTTLGSTDTSNIQKEINAGVESLQLSGTLRIGKTDNLFHRIQLTLTVAPTEGGTADATVMIGSDIQLSNFNQPVTVTVPTAYITAEELMAKVMGVIMNTMMQNQGGQPFVVPTPEPVAPLGQLDSDGDGISDEIEGVIGTDPTKKDTDGDGFTDKVEIKNGYNPLGAGKLPPAIADLIPKNF